MTECVFCKIVRGQAPCTKIYEDENCIAFLDIKPITAGHMLIIPKVHAETLSELHDNFAGELLRTGKKMSIALKKSKLQCKGVNYLLAEGKEAGQEIFHVHLHVIPRYSNDGFYFHMPSDYNDEKDREELESIAAKIRL